MAGVLAGGPDTFLSHRAAANLWGLVKEGRAPEVTTARRMRSLKGITRHCAILPMDEVTVHRGIPITTVPRSMTGPDTGSTRAFVIAIASPEAISAAGGRRCGSRVAGRGAWPASDALAPDITTASAAAILIAHLPAARGP